MAAYLESAAGGMHPPVSASNIVAQASYYIGWWARVGVPEESAAFLEQELTTPEEDVEWMDSFITSLATEQ